MESTCWSGELDYVERLEAENAKLRAALETRLMSEYIEKQTALFHENVRLKAENAKLRAALDAIRRHSDPGSEAHDLALRALED